MSQDSPLGHAILACVLVSIAQSPLAHVVEFKSPGPAMHFTQGQPIIIFADLFDSNNQLGMILCPSGQTITNTSAGPAQCSAGGTATGWPQMQVLVDGILQSDAFTSNMTVPGSTVFNDNLNPDPIDFYRFSVTGLPAGPHQMKVRGLFAPPPDFTGETIDSAPITIVVDPVPGGRTTLTLNANVTGAINWNNLIVVGNGHTVNPNGGSVVIKNTLVTGLGSRDPQADSFDTPGIDGAAASIDIEDSVFEATGALYLTAAGAATVSNNEFRANNLITFDASIPDASPVISLSGKSAQAKLFQGNRIGAGRVAFDGTKNWLIGGDTDSQSNIVIGPRGTLYLVDGTSDVVVRGNYVHHNYRGGWSQGFNMSYSCEFCNQADGAGILVEHNLFRGSSWPVQDVTGEFRYNLVYGYGHTWVRSAISGASIHHNVFAPEPGGGDLDQGIWFYGGETNIQVYNNTFDGGGNVAGIFAGPTIQVNNASHVDSVRNNLITFSRNQANDNPGDARIVGDAGTVGAADYNAFYSPDNDNHDNYAIAGMSEPAVGAHDVSGSGAGVTGAVNGQLAATPFSGPRIYPYDSLVDEGAVWQRTQKLSEILAAFRLRYTPAAGSPVVDAGDPQDNDGHGRRTDVGAIDRGGHDADRFGIFGDVIFANSFG